MNGSSAGLNYDRVVKTACHMCYASCGLNVYIKGGKIVKVDGMVEHPINKGEICITAEQALDYVYSEERLKYPMKKEGGEWKRISWDEALDTIATKLRESKEKYGDTSLAVFAGDPTAMQGASAALLAWRFCDIYGTPNRCSVESICHIIRSKAQLFTLGKTTNPDVEEAKCIILWGHNPHASLPPEVRRIENAIKNGAKLIVIDPRRIPFAKGADIHAQPRPGTDAALALAMVNTIIVEGLYDKEFVEKWTIGFDKLAEHVKKYSAEEVERITWVPAGTIKEMARTYAKTKPACIAQGTNSLDQQASGFQNTRVIAALEAITGNIDVRGGSIRVSGKLRLKHVRLSEKVQSLKLIGAEEYPITYKMGDRIFGGMQCMEWPDILLTGKPYQITTMIVAGANPAVVWPNSNKVRQALEKLDFLVVMDIFMTATAEMADIVLPATTFFERTDISAMGGEILNAPYVILRKPVIEPLWESWPDWKFWFELAKRMGYGQYFPWEDIEEALDYFLEPMGLTIRQLKEESPSGVTFGALEYGEFERKGFNTPSGKIELYSQALKDLGYDPLPEYLENPESPISTPELAREYPLILTTGARELEYWHSQHRNLPELRRRVPEALGEIHPNTAEKYGIRDGDMMVIETKRGGIEIKAKVTEDILPNVVNVPHGWSQANVNILTDNTPADPISGYPVLKGLLCRVMRKA